MRMTEDISQGWKFWLNEEKGGGETVSLPHTVELTPANSSGCRNFQGTCVYKNSIMIPEEAKQKRVMAEFAGAMGVTQLFINGKHVYTHWCSYIPMRVDLTEWLEYGAENEFKLILDNSDNEDVPPGKAQDALDFTYDGGLYRCAKLVYKEKLYITDELIEDETAGGGVYLWSEQIDDVSAVVNAQVHVRNHTDETQEFSVSITLFHKGQLEGRTTGRFSLEAGAAEHFTQKITLLDPQLWSPEHPELYDVKVELLGGGDLTDCVEMVYGIRDFRFTYENNLVFNGESRRLSGANYHPTYPYVGYAVPDNLLRRDAKKLRKLGMENVRSHYPLPEAFVDECNHLGITMIVANPGWQWFKEGIFQERLIRNMRQIVRWQRNNPSVLLWEPMPNESVVPQSVQQILHDAVHEECPHGACFTASDHGPTDVSYRMYDPGMLEPGMEGYNPIKRYGTKSDYPVWIREYNDAPDNWTDHNCAWRTPRGWGDYAQMRAVERMLGLDSQCSGNNYIDVYNNEMICGYGVWPAIEHNRGYHINPCWGGYLDLFRIPKLTAYFMESQQDMEAAGAVLHIGNWWTDISPVDVTVFSNAETVRLYHDDVLVGEQKPEEIAVKHPPFVFKDVHNRFKGRDRSVLRAEALCGDKVVATETIKTPGVPYQLVLSADTENLPIAQSGDMIVVRCAVTDRDGTVVPYTSDNHPLVFEVEGGELVGDESIGANPVRPEAGIAAVLVKTNGNQRIKVTARLLWLQRNERTAIRPAELELYCS